MTDHERLVELAHDLEIPLPNQRWPGLDALMPVLESVTADGGYFLVKLDGDRTVRPYTAVINLQPGEDWLVRRDDETMEQAVIFVLARYAEHRRGGGRG